MCAAEAESSSSSEDEDTEKFREAVWSGAHSSNTDVEKNGAQSKRMDPSRHEEDGNELQLTPEFKSHVAKKLGAILDSCISEVSSKPPEPKPDSCENGDDDDDDDEGFRLFSTSLPGNWRKEPTPPPAPKRPPAPSSSDSDSEMESRFREAAVSVLDLIPPSTEKSKEKEGMNSGGVDEGSKESAELKKKKKKKKKKASAEGEETCSKGKETVGHEQRTREEQSAEENVMKKKKKKKKRIRLDEGE